MLPLFPEHAPSASSDGPTPSFGGNFAQPQSSPVDVDPALSWAHPVVAEWFTRRFGTPTEPQIAGWPAILAGRTTLISAPTGSGKTLSAFLVAIDSLLRKAVAGDLQPNTQILYVSPLKALSNDVQKNLDAPLREIQQLALERGYLCPEIRTAVRTGDTLPKERQAMLKASAAYPRYDSRVALHSAYLRTQPCKSASCRNHHHRRGSRRRRRQARHTSRTLARTSGCSGLWREQPFSRRAHRRPQPRSAAHRPFRDAEPALARCEFSCRGRSRR